LRKITMRIIIAWGKDEEKLNELIPPKKGFFNKIKMKDS